MRATDREIGPLRGNARTFHGQMRARSEILRQRRAQWGETLFAPTGRLQGRIYFTVTSIGMPSFTA